MIPRVEPSPIEISYTVRKQVKRVIQRVLENCVEDERGCWVWQGHVSNSGYGKITGYDDKAGAKRTLYVHRVSTSWFWCGISGDVIPSHMWGVKANLDHLCENKLCVNPDHILFVSHRANNARGASNTAKNARKTGCPREAEHGPYDKTYPSGWRYCSKCKAEKERRRRQRKP